MNKPRYIEGMLKMIFLWLGIAFIFFGFLSFYGILKPSAKSMVQEPTMLGIIFGLLGIVFIIVTIVLKTIVAAKNKLHSELLSNGIEINGTVEKVYLQKNMQYGHRHPYRILYTYTYQGREYHHKSCFLWDKPNFVEGDSIKVYTNAFGKSTVTL